MLVHRRVTPSIKFACTHLYTWVERGTVTVKYLAQEHNTMSPARTRTRTARFGVECTNHEAAMPPTEPRMPKIDKTTKQPAHISAWNDFATSGHGCVNWNSIWSSRKVPVLNYKAMYIKVQPKYSIFGSAITYQQEMSVQLQFKAVSHVA